MACTELQLDMLPPPLLLMTEQLPDMILTMIAGPSCWNTAIIVAIPGLYSINLLLHGMTSPLYLGMTQHG